MIKKNGIRGLGNLRGSTFPSYAYGVSKDASIVVGSVDDDYSQAFIWDKKNKMRNLKLVLTNDFKLNLDGWILISTSSISDDGKTIVGWGYNPDKKFEAWIAKVRLLIAFDSDEL